MKSLLTFVFLLTFMATGCSKKNTSSTQPEPFRIADSMFVDGHTRTYLVNLPPNYYDSASFSLVIALHGAGGSGAQFETSTGLTGKADSSHFVIVYPDGFLGPGNNRTWNAGECCGASAMENINDVGFIDNLIDTLLAHYKIDPKRVYVIGHSNGGMLAYRIASELSDKIAAIAVNSCSMVIDGVPHPSRPVPILHLHSILDENVPFDGGVGNLTDVYFPPVDSVLAVWAGIDACNATPQTDSFSNYSITQWNGCALNTTVELYLTKDGGHSWPGGNFVNPNADPPSTAIDANDVIWNFLKGFQLP